MEEVLIKNGNVLLFENNDVVIKKINVFIKNGKIEKIFLDDEKSKNIILVFLKEKIII